MMKLDPQSQTPPTDSAAERNDHRRWRHGPPLIALKRLHISYPATLAAAAFITIVEQIIEQYLVDPAFVEVTATTVLKRLVLPVLTVYMLIALHSLTNITIDALDDLRPEVKIPDEEYDAYLHRMAWWSQRTELVLLAASALVVVLLFAVLRNPLPIWGRVYLPSNPLLAVYSLLVYTFVGWVGLVLVYSSLKHARVLAKLARCPLNTNAMDPTNLLAFGRLSLSHSMALIGIILILLTTLGMPTRVVDYLVLILTSLGGTLVLFWPLTGVHTQMRRAKDQALHWVNDELLGIQSTLLYNPRPSTSQLGELADRADQLTKFRSLILQTPTWPFRDAFAAVRAVVASLSPLIYFLLTQLISSYIVPLFTR